MQLRKIRRRNLWFSAFFAASICLTALSTFTAFALDEDNQITPPLEQVFVDDPRIDESSGLARSLVFPNRLWTHNDSGDKSRIFAVDREKGTTQAITIDGAQAADWEDVASGKLAGKNWIIVGDVGDNSRKRKSVLLYAFQEPSEAKLPPSVPPDDVHVIEATYPDGAGDCEAIALDPNSQHLLMVKKTLTPFAGVYAVDLASLVDAKKKPNDTTRLTAKHLLTLPIPMITSMDIRDDGKALAITTYRDLFLYQRNDGESWEGALKRLPAQMVLPKLRQIEAVCFDQQGEIWVTSERSPMALFKLNARSLFSVNRQPATETR